MVSGKDVVNLLFMMVSSTIVAVAPMVSPNGGPGRIFSYHPSLMGIAFTLVLTLGFWMYNYENLPGDWIDSRPGRRTLHVGLQLSGIVCLILGYAAAVRAHQLEGAGFFQVSSRPPVAFVHGPSWLHQAHVLIGHVAIVLVFSQVIVGVLKYRAVTDDEEGNDGAYKIHETIGNSIYFLGLTNVVIGVWCWDAWSLATRCVITLTLLTSLVFGPRWDGSRGFLTEQPEKSGHSHGPAPSSLGLQV